MVLTLAEEGGWVPMLAGWTSRVVVECQGSELGSASGRDQAVMEEALEWVEVAYPVVSVGVEAVLRRAVEEDGRLMGGEAKVRLVGMALEVATAARLRDSQAAADRMKAALANPASQPPAHAQTPGFSRCWRLVGCE